MPCRSDPELPGETTSRCCARIILHLFPLLEIEFPCEEHILWNATSTVYGDRIYADEWSAAVCSALSGYDAADFIVLKLKYSNPKEFDFVMDWWKVHQLQDKKRLEMEAKKNES